jgi:hypothetical protein
MVKKKKIKKKTVFKKLAPADKWNDGEKISIVSPLEVDCKKGISIRVGKMVGKYEKYTHKLWIDEKFNFTSWLIWVIEKIKKHYFELFGKQISLGEEIEIYKTKKDELTKQLTELQIKIEIVEKKDEENKKLIELLNKTNLKYKRNFREIYSDFCNIIEESIKNNRGEEEEIKRKIKAEPWLLGLECFVEAKNQDVDIQTEIDLHVKTKYNKDVIIEIKSPNISPLNRKNHERSRFVFSPELSEAIDEIIYYMRRTDVYSERAGEGVYGIQKAEGVIIMGSYLNDEQKRILKELNFHLYPHIRIVTFDELKDNIEREINLLEIVKNEKTKN